MSLNLELNKGNTLERDRVVKFARLSATDMISATIFGTMKELFLFFSSASRPTFQRSGLKPMSNAKPYLFGTVLGASAMYVALQYHVVHSHDGFQMVPRTPQHSVGLAYADVRSWTPSQWTDRPELARALMAHGSSDLISQSVATSLADSVAEENSTLDQLRSFLSKPASDTAGGASAGLLQIPETSRPALNGDSGSSDELNPLPFPRDAKKPELGDPFAVAQSTDKTIDSGSADSAVTRDSAAPSKPPGSSRFSAADIIEGLRSDAGSPVDSFNAAGSATNKVVNSNDKAAAKPSSTSQFTQAMEDQIFGSPAPATKSSGSTKQAAADVSQSMFEEVSSQLESRAQAALNRAQSAATEKAGSVLSDGAASSQNYLRQRVEQAAPEAVKSLIPGSTNAPADKATKTGSTLLDQFDPFLE